MLFVANARRPIGKPCAMFSFTVDHSWCIFHLNLLFSFLVVRLIKQLQISHTVPSTMPSLKLFVAYLLLLVVLSAGGIQAFAVAPRTSKAPATSRCSMGIAFRSTPSDNNENGDSKLSKLGYSEKEIQRSRDEGDQEEVKVNVNLLPDVDAVTLTAIGFGLIAFNFFVLANSGDGGIAGAVATIINMSKQ